MKLFCTLVPVVMAVLSSCQPTRPVARPGSQYLGGMYQPIVHRPQEVVDTVSYFDPTPMGGSPRITINLSEQKAYLFKGDALAGVALVATGKEGYNTPSGNYKIMEKIKDKRSNLYGWIYDASGNVINNDADIRKDKVPPGGRFDGAEMPYWMRLTSTGIGMHQGPIPVPGQPASHGCIRVSKTVVSDFFQNVSVGTPVTVEY